MWSSLAFRHLKGVALFCLFLVPGAAAPVVITDDFDDGVLNPAFWKAWSPLTMPSIEETGGEARIATVGQLGDNRGGIQVRGLAAGDFEARVMYRMETNFDLFADNQNDSAVALLWGPLASFGAAARGTRGGAVESPKVGDYDGRIDPLDDADHHFFTTDQSGGFRVMRTGDFYEVSYWDGQDWAPWFAGTSAMTGPIEIRLAVFAGLGRTVEAAFDDFYLKADALVTEVPEPGAFGTALLGLGALALRALLGRGRTLGL